MSSTEDYVLLYLPVFEIFNSSLLLKYTQKNITIF